MLIPPADTASFNASILSVRSEPLSKLHDVALVLLWGISVNHRMCVKTDIGRFEAVLQYWAGKTEKSHKIRQGQLVCGAIMSYILILFHCRSLNITVL
jgi:hypothetical protein